MGGKREAGAIVSTDTSVLIGKYHLATEMPTTGVTTPRPKGAGLLGTSPGPVVPGHEYSRKH